MLKVLRMARTSLGCETYSDELDDRLEKAITAVSELIADRAALLEALEKLVFMESRPTDVEQTPQQIYEFWKYESEQGDEFADAMLFALDAIAKATGADHA